MPTKKSANKDVLLAELDLHKLEFSALRQEILELIESERQYLNLSLIAFGAGLGFAPMISEQKLYVILLLFPLVFHVLLWEMLKAVRSVSLISGYLVGTLIPRVNVILKTLGKEDNNAKVLDWEIYIATKHLMKPSDFLATSLTPTRHWIPILAVGALIITYALIARTAEYTASLGELSLIIINLLLLIWAAVQNLITTHEAAQLSKNVKKRS